MKYLLLIYLSENAQTEDEREQCMKDSTQLCHELKAKGSFLGASPLQSVVTATTLSIRNGKKFITDGPFAETTEQLGGYYIVDVANLDEALEVASRIPGVKVGSVEIRPIFELPGLPSVT